MHLVNGKCVRTHARCAASRCVRGVRGLQPSRPSGSQSESFNGLSTPGEPPDPFAAAASLCARPPCSLSPRWSAVPCLLGDAAFTQFVLLHLAVLDGRQLTHEF